LVVGLGNPGLEYANTRHNVGRMVLDELARRASATFKSHKTNAIVAEGRTAPGGPRFVLAKPNTYMNVSGGPVAQLLRCSARVCTRAFAGSSGTASLRCAGRDCGLASTSILRLPPVARSANG
jgi:hypothetical protein